MNELSWYHKVELKKAALFPELLSSNLVSSAVKTELESVGFMVYYIEEYEGRRFGAVKLGNVRLIDNIRMNIWFYIYLITFCSIAYS